MVNVLLSRKLEFNNLESNNCSKIAKAHMSSLFLLNVRSEITAFFQIVTFKGISEIRRFHLSSVCK